MEDNKMEVGTFKSSIKIADDVISCIAALAATDVEGVASMAGNATNDLITKLGVKSLSKGVKISVVEEDVKANLAINVRYGCNIPAVCKNVQDRVRASIESMTNFTVSEVNVTIAGISVDE